MLIQTENKIALAPTTLGAEFSPYDYFINGIPNPHTRRAKFNDLKNLRRFLDKNGLEMLSVQRQDLGLFREHLSKLNYSIASIKRHISTIKDFYTYLFDESIIDSNPTINLKSPRQSYTVGKTEALTPKELSTLFNSFGNSVKDTRNHLICAFMYYTGCRVSALAKLTVNDLVYKDDTYHITLKEKFGSTNKCISHIYLTNLIRKYIALNKITKSFVIRSLIKGKDKLGSRQLCQRNIYDVIKRCCKTAGIKDIYSPHSFRASSISNFINKTNDIRRAQLHANLKSISTTTLYHKHYNSINQKDLDNLTI